MKSRVLLKIYVLVLFVWGLISCAIAVEQSREVQLRFIDSMTGYAVRPSVTVLDLDHQQVYLSLNPEQLQPGGRLSMMLPSGSYLISAHAPGYDSMSAQVVVGSELVPPFEFHMDPLETPRELETKFLRSLHRDDVLLVAGFVVDDETGEPLAGVGVSDAERGVSALSDERGFFALYLLLRNAQGINRSTATVLFEKPGYVTEERQFIEVWSRGDALYRIRLTPGAGVRSVDERQYRHRSDEGVDQSNCSDCPTQTSANAEEVDGNPPGGFQPLSFPTVVLPKYIRVGRNCTTRYDCTRVEVYTVDTYCKYVLPAEWFSCWGNLAGGMNSLKAGAVAVRSYGVSFVYTPATSNYDICDTTACQVFGSSQSSNANAAVDQTTRYVLLTSGGTIARSEYSAENNNNGCGDGYSGTGGAWPCIYDPVCTGFPDNGHGRGMCQWGSARWATGRRLSSSQACTTSAPLHGYGTKDWLQILNHYYSPGGYQVVQGATATIQGITPSPNPVNAGSTVTLQYSVNANDTLTTILGASIAPAGSGNWVSDPPRDLRVTLAAGSNNVSRLFNVLAGTSPGAYDLWAALWYDKNNSNRIDAGDFMIDDRIFAQALNVKTATNLSVANASGTVGQTIPLSATLRRTWDNIPLSNRLITFRVEGNIVGNANTDTSGVASLDWTVSSGALGPVDLSAEFAGDSLYNGSNGNATFTRYASTTLTVANQSGRRGEIVPLSATLNRVDDGTPLEGKTIVFRVDGAFAGYASTNTSGIATVDYAIPLSSTVGTHTLTAQFGGGSYLNAGSGSGSLTVQKVLVQGTITLENRPDPSGLNARIVVKQGANSEVFNVLLPTSGAYAVETDLAGIGATVSAVIPDGSWLRRRSNRILSGIVNLDFTLPNGDVNRDGVIANDDLLVLLLNYGSSNSSFDLNADSTTDDKDLAIVLHNFGLVGDEE